MSSTLFTHSEFADLSNRSEYAYCYGMGVPAEVSRCAFENLSREALASSLITSNWNTSATVAKRNQYQRALAGWAKAFPNNGQVDIVQLRALEHLSFLDRLLWRVFDILECRRTYIDRMGNKAWDCLKHGLNKSDAAPCRKAYESWIARQNF